MSLFSVCFLSVCLAGKYGRWAEEMESKKLFFASLFARSEMESAKVEFIWENVYIGWVNKCV